MNAFRLESTGSLRLPRIGALKTSKWSDVALSSNDRKKNEMNISRKSELKTRLDCDVVITQLYEDEKVINYCLQSGEGVPLKVLRTGEYRHVSGSLRRTINSSTSTSVGEYGSDKRVSSVGITTPRLENLLKEGSGHYNVNDVELVTRRNKKLRKQATPSPRTKKPVLSKNCIDKRYYNVQKKSLTEDLDIKDVNLNKKIKSPCTNGQFLISESHKSDVTEGYIPGDNDNQNKGLSPENNSSEITDFDERVHELRDGVTKKRSLAGINSQCDSEEEFDVGYPGSPIAVQLVSKGGSSHTPKIITVDPFTFEKCIRWIDGLPKKFSHMNCLSVVQE